MLPIVKKWNIVDQNKVDEYYNPLQWWKENARIYPILSTLAQRLLSQTATSAPSERLFNIAGNGITIAKDRASLNPEHAEETIFLRDNWNMINEWNAQKE